MLKNCMAEYPQINNQPTIGFAFPAEGRRFGSRIYSAAAAGRGGVVQAAPKVLRTAMTIIAMLPVVLLYIFPHGLTIGGIKERFLVPAEVPKVAPAAQGGPTRRR